MMTGSGPVLRGILTPFEVVLGSWIGLEILFSALLGPSYWSVILGSLAWVALLAVFLEFKRRDLRHWPFRGSPRSRPGNR